MSNNEFKFLSAAAVILMTAITFSITACNEASKSTESGSDTTSLLQDTAVIDSVLVCDTVATDSVFMKK